MLDWADSTCWHNSSSVKVCHCVEIPIGKTNVLPFSFVWGFFSSKEPFKCFALPPFCLEFTGEFLYPLCNFCMNCDIFCEYPVSSIFHLLPMLNQFCFHFLIGYEDMNWPDNLKVFSLIFQTVVISLYLLLFHNWRSLFPYPTILKLGFHLLNHFCSSSLYLPNCQ